MSVAKEVKQYLRKAGIPNKIRSKGSNCVYVYVLNQPDDVVERLRAALSKYQHGNETDGCPQTHFLSINSVSSFDAMRT